MPHIFFRETLVLCIGATVAGIAALVLRRAGNGLELLHGIVVPIAFCLGRAALAPHPPRKTTTLRRFVYQVLLAFALTMLLLFEMGMGLFAGAKDIPAAVWAIVISFGIVYVGLIGVTESMRTSASVEKSDNGTVSW